MLRQILGGHRSAWFLLLSVCCFVEFDISIICHVLVYCLGSFLLQDLFLSLQVFAFKRQNVNVLLTRILYCGAGLAMICESMAVHIPRLRATRRADY